MRFVQLAHHFIASQVEELLGEQIAIIGPLRHPEQAACGNPLVE